MPAKYFELGGRRGASVWCFCLQFIPCLPYWVALLEVLWILFIFCLVTGKVTNSAQKMWSFRWMDYGLSKTQFCPQNQLGFGGYPWSRPIVQLYFECPTRINIRKYLVGSLFERVGSTSIYKSYLVYHSFRVYCELLSKVFFLTLDAIIFFVFFFFLLKHRNFHYMLCRIKLINSISWF